MINSSLDMQWCSLIIQLGWTYKWKLQVAAPRYITGAQQASPHQAAVCIQYACDSPCKASRWQECSWVEQQVSASLHVCHTGWRPSAVAGSEHLLSAAAAAAAGLAQNKYLEDKAFLNYLKYLEYWRQPQYATYIRCSKVTAGLG
jgi:hypothetical protein